MTARKKTATRKPALTIGFLGAGNMAGALILGLIQSKLVRPSSIVASDVKSERLKQLADRYKYPRHDRQPRSSARRR